MTQVLDLVMEVFGSNFELKVCNHSFQFISSKFLGSLIERHHQGQSHSMMSCSVFNSTSFYTHLGICWGKILAKEPSADKDGHDPENNYIGKSITYQSEHNHQLQMVTRHQDKLEKWI